MVSQSKFPDLSKSCILLIIIIPNYGFKKKKLKKLNFKNIDFVVLNLRLLNQLFEVSLFYPSSW